LPTKALSGAVRPGRTGRTAVYPGSSTALVVEDRKTLKNCEIASTPADWWSCSRMRGDRKPKGAELSDSDGSWFKPASTAGKSEPGYTGDFDIHVWNLWQTQRRDAQS